MIISNILCILDTVSQTIPRKFNIKIDKSVAKTVLTCMEVVNYQASD